MIALAAYSISAQSAIRIISGTDIVRHLTEEPHSVSTPVNQIMSKPMPRWCPNVWKIVFMSPVLGILNDFSHL